ncbi:MAG: hypothetical protein IPL49_12300 [Saprospirales bacterium]|nr:hypothetical protein [Saprospirales bacterium]
MLHNLGISIGVIDHAHPVQGIAHIVGLFLFTSFRKIGDISSLLRKIGLIPPIFLDYVTLFIANFYPFGLSAGEKQGGDSD